MTGPWSDGVAEIPIEERDGAELLDITGRAADGTVASVRIAPENCPVANFAFDVTPARLVSGLITERGVCPASAEGLAALYPEQTRKMKHRRLRRQLIETARLMNARGINQGTSGNLSARVEGGLLITPSGVDYDTIQPRRDRRDGLRRHLALR